MSDGDLPRPRAVTVGELDALSAAAAMSVVGGVAENARWVAESALRTRPFGSIGGMVAAFTRAIVEAPTADRRALVAGHPDLAGKAAIAGELTPESTAEQASTPGRRTSAPSSLRLSST